VPDKDYSHRDVTDKLGLKPGFVVRVAGIQFSSAADLLARVEAKVGRKLAAARSTADVILYWPKTAGEITPTLAKLKEKIMPNGGIWVITAKKNRTSAGGMAYFNQDTLIALGKAAGLVDNKICSLNERESAMRFVIRRDERPQAKDESRSR
jgi:16S rRNA G1207 methylase RsmC